MTIDDTSSAGDSGYGDLASLGQKLKDATPEDRPAVLAEISELKAMVGVVPPPAADLPRVELLREAATLISGDRNVTYGPPTQNFQNIADFWTVQFGHKLKDGEKFSGAEVAQALMLLKLARMIAQPKRDNYLDLAGYAGCGWESELENGNTE